ncbi:hypothetical protein QBC35DRAFT_12389 [Podospora australis]|uniref:Uncharacterized protein n=1 Tax=Podospora australis TaxID=1536484 RepID=A0AAN6X198_9PEZI|nr:hypothetical protein QBC35DRAFT_12389 [Podospora australis]
MTPWAISNQSDIINRPHRVLETEFGAVGAIAPICFVKIVEIRSSTDLIKKKPLSYMTGGTRHPLFSLRNVSYSSRIFPRTRRKVFCSGGDSDVHRGDGTTEWRISIFQKGDWGRACNSSGTAKLAYLPDGRDNLWVLSQPQHMPFRPARNMTEPQKVSNALPLCFPHRLQLQHFSFAFKSAFLMCECAIQCWRCTIAAISLGRQMTGLSALLSTTTCDAPFGFVPTRLTY